MKIRATLLASALFFSLIRSDLVHAQEEKEQNIFAFGIEGDPVLVNRTIEIDMLDDRELQHKRIDIKHGETIRFVVKNKGNKDHELFLGTKKFIEVTDRDFKDNPGITHDAPYLIYVGPGDTTQFVWQFTDIGILYFACIVPGHFKTTHVTKLVVK